MRRVVIFAVALFVASGFAGISFSGESRFSGTPRLFAEEIRKKCPVMGDDVNTNIFTDYKGTRIYFCCKDCPEKFKNDPEKYMKKM